MTFRVPLLWPVDAVIERVDPSDTEIYDPDGNPVSGYDHDFREPRFEQQDSLTVAKATLYLPAIRVPCQVEVPTYDELRMAAAGDNPLAKMALVLHRQQLEELDLLDPVTGNCIIRRRDKLIAIEKDGRPALTPEELPLYIYELRPASWGFGPDGYDLHIAYMTHDPRA